MASDSYEALFDEFLSKRFGDMKPEAEIANMRAAFAAGARLCGPNDEQALPLLRKVEETGILWQQGLYELDAEVAGLLSRLDATGEQGSA